MAQNTGIQFALNIIFLYKLDFEFRDVWKLVLHMSRIKIHMAQNIGILLALNIHRLVFKFKSGRLNIYVKNIDIHFNFFFHKL